MRLLGRNRESQADEQDSAPDEAPGPQPEREEPRLEEPGPGDLSKRDYFAILRRSVKEALDDNVTSVAAAIAYYAFLSIPAALLLAVGIFSLVAGPDTITTIIDKLRGIVPAEALDLFESSLTRIAQKQSDAGIAMFVVGLVLAIWSLTGAMQTVMWALNTAYERDETRGFARKRLTAIAMLLFALVAFALVFGLLILGPLLSDVVGEAIGLEAVVKWVWWTAQWPILFLGLLAAFAAILYFGPNVDHPRWQFLSFGAVLAVVVWLAASAAFAFYVSKFGSYNKTWGSLAAVIIMLTWLWLSGLALLIGAEVNAETERSRELRRGEPAEEEIQAPAKA